MPSSVVAKKKVKSKPEKKAVVSKAKLNKLADEAMADFKAAAKERYDRAKLIYNKQDDDTQDALDRMIALLVRISRKHMWIGARGDKEARIVMQIPEETIYHNMYYMACEILKDLALMDVRVASYTFPPDLCVECGKQLKPTKAKARKKK